jgi:hypothetical protein
MKTGTFKFYHRVRLQIRNLTNTKLKSKSVWNWFKFLKKLAENASQQKRDNRNTSSPHIERNVQRFPSRTLLMNYGTINITNEYMLF